MSDNNFMVNLDKQAHVFLDSLFRYIKESKLELESNFLDHLCFRVATSDEYDLYKARFSEIGSLLIAAQVGAREISTFKLENPIQYGERTINIIELPNIKRGSCYETGFEHAEFVINESFSEFIIKYPELDFDTSATKKSHNPELRLNFSKNLSLKLHHLALEEVIEREIMLND